MAPKKPAPKTKATPAPLPPMPTAGKKKEGVCGVDGYCCQGKSPEECCGGSCGGNCGCGGSKPSVWDCHILAMLKKRAFWLGTFVSAVVISLFQWVWHGPVMMHHYAQSAHLWRPMADIAANGPLFIAHHLLLAVVFTLLFLLMGGYSLCKGIKNGVLIASPLALGALVLYAVQPFPAIIPQLWAVGHLLQGAILGFALAAVASCNWCSGGSGCCGGSCGTNGKGCC